MEKKREGYLHTIKRFWQYEKKYLPLLIFDLFCAALTCVCELVLPQILRTITNMAVNDLASLTVELVVRMAVLYGILKIIDALAAFSMTYIGHGMGLKIETAMRKDAFEHLQKLGSIYYSNTKVGQIMGRVTNDLFEVTEFAHHCPEEFFIAAVKIVVSFVILCRYSLMLTLAMFCIFPVIVVTAVKLNELESNAFRNRREQIGELNSQIEESLLGEKVIKAFCAEDASLAKLEEGNKLFEKYKLYSYKIMSLIHISTRLFDGIMYLVVILLGGICVVKGTIEPGDLVAYTLYVSTLIATWRRIVEYTEQFQMGVTGIERFYDIVDSPIEIEDAEGAKDFVLKEGKVELKDLSFEYADDGNKVLSNINLTINPGERVALVGPSGAGKTTVCNLIPRFYDVKDGSVLIDGQNVKDVTLKSLRSAIGIVQQDVFLFSGTVADNIAYGKPGASREEIVKAAEMAGADEFIRQLKDGYDTYIGERGVKLSGGQKQRVSIARLFLKNPGILILDEATSALDNENEIIVSRSLERLAKGRTTLTIAHRLTTVKNYDRIVVLTDEGISEEGSHEELLALGGIYYRLWNQMLPDE